MVSNDNCGTDVIHIIVGRMKEEMKVKVTEKAEISGKKKERNTMRNPF